MRRHHANCRVEALSEAANGEVRVVLRFADGTASALPCVFERLVHWREKVDDITIVQRLASRRVDVWVEDGAIVEMKTLQPASEHQSVSRAPRSEVRDGRGEERLSDAGADTRRMLSEVEALLDEEASWLYKAEREMLASFIAQLEEGHALSERQLDCLSRFRDRADKRKLPKCYRG